MSPFRSASLYSTCVLCALLFLGSSRAAAKHPNIVYVMADDLGIGDVACYGGDRCQTSTPAFDSLARDGMMFTDAHSVASVCVPSRIAIMTGRYAWRFAKPSQSGPWGFLNPQLPSGAFTLGTMLKRAGYRTGYVGKWHLGTLMHTKDGKNQGVDNVDYERPLRVGPNDFGFDYSFILPGSLDMYPYVFVRNGHFQGEVTAQKGWSAFNRVGPAAEDFEDYKVLDAFATEAEAFLDRNAEQARNGRPFFLYVALTSPHTPTSPSPAFEGTSKLGLYGDFVEETDATLGRVLAALDKHRLADNTLVVATSDHGAAPYAGNVRKATPNLIRELEALGHYASGIYRGYKFTLYEGGLRVPFLVRWPGRVKPGSKCHGLVGLNDMAATVAEIANVELAPDEAPDSISILPVLTSPSSPSPRTSLVMQSPLAFAIRDRQWKLALSPGSGSRGMWGTLPIPEQAWGAAMRSFGSAPTADDLRKAPFVQLFDLDTDVRETKNLASDRPEVVARLAALLDKTVADGRSTPGPALENDVPHVEVHRNSVQWIERYGGTRQ
ncbi:MAG: arylsulfatase [Bryobacterales bacterium]|nr:arylsulfatase [Bryobacterales bacterium]